MTKISREAQKDAAETAKAMMSYGEGAGNKRKLILTAVEYKQAKVPGYKEAFDRAYDAQDMAKIAKRAKVDRRTKDFSVAATKNVGALARGDRRGMSPLFAAAVVTIGVAHATGYDKKVLAYTKRKSGDVRAWLKRKL